MKKTPIPLGIKILLALSATGVIYCLWQIISGNAEFIFLGSPLSENAALLAIILSLLLELAWIFSVLNRYSWGWKLYLVTNMSYAINLLFELSSSKNLDTSGPIWFTLILISTASLYAFKKRGFFNR